MLEILESRQLMSASFNAATGEVSVVGTDNPDTIAFTKGATKLFVVENNNSVSAFDLAKVKKIYANGKLGRDKITVDAAITIPAELHGGGCEQTGRWYAIDWEADELQGGSGNDKLYADNSPAFLHGNGGDDTIIFQGESFVRGDSGNDTLIRTVGFDGISSANGDGGTDTFSVAGFRAGQFVGNSSDLTEAGIGYNDLTYKKFNGGTPEVYDCENFIGGAGNDSIYGTNGNNVIRGNGGDDLIIAKAGNDTVFGGAGNDRINGGLGFDKIYGQGDDDIIYSRDNVPDVVDAGAGNDSVKLDIFDLPAAGVEHYLA